MNVTVTPAQSRMLAVALLIVAIAIGVGLFAVPAVLLHRHYDAAFADLTDKVQRYQRVAAQQADWSKALERLRALEGRRFLLRNQAPNLAGAELQDMVREAIESNGGRIVTIQTAQPRDESGFKQVGMNVQMFANTASLQRILYAIESRVPYLFIDNVSMRSTAFRGYRPNPGVEPEISVQMDVSAFLLAAEERK